LPAVLTEQGLPPSAPAPAGIFMRPHFRLAVSGDAAETHPCAKTATSYARRGG
jgi:hypothetical protein